MSRLFRAALLSIALVPVQGCITAATYVANRPTNQALQQMAGWCAADAGVRWFGSRPSQLDIWMPGEMDREPITAKAAATAKPFGSAGWASAVLQSGLAQRVFVKMTPRGDPTGAEPALGDKSGVYEAELLPISHARCARARSALAKRNAGLAPEHQARPEKCVAYRYVGEFDGRPMPDMFVPFQQNPPPAPGIYRSGQVLFVGGERRATEILYGAVRPGGDSIHVGTWGAKACEVAGQRKLLDP